MAFPPTQMILSNSGEEIDLTTETTLLADKAIDLSIVEDWEPHCTTTAISEDAIPAILTAQNKKIPWGTQQEPPSLEQSQQPRPLSTNQIPGVPIRKHPFNNIPTILRPKNHVPITNSPPPPPSTPPNPYPGQPLPPKKRKKTPYPPTTLTQDDK